MKFNIDFERTIFQSPRVAGWTDYTEKVAFLEVEYSDQDFRIRAYLIERWGDWSRDKVYGSNDIDEVEFDITFEYDENSRSFRSIPPNQVMRRVAEFVYKNLDEHPWLVNFALFFSGE